MVRPTGFEPVTYGLEAVGAVISGVSESHRLFSTPPKTIPNSAVLKIAKNHEILCAIIVFLYMTRSRGIDFLTP